MKNPADEISEFWQESLMDRLIDATHEALGPQKGSWFTKLALKHRLEERKLFLHIKWFHLQISGDKEAAKGAEPYWENIEHIFGDEIHEFMKLYYERYPRKEKDS